MEPTIEQLIEQVHSYFEDHEIDTTNSKLDIRGIEDVINLPINDIAILMCNIESTELMQELVDGEIHTFDPWCESDFNDGYLGLMYDLGLMSDEDDNFWS